jgi:hypothetical protein
VEAVSGADLAPRMLLAPLSGIFFGQRMKNGVKSRN